MSRQPIPAAPRGQLYSEWLTTGFNYDPDAIYTSSREAKGFSRVTTIRVPPDFDSLVNMMLDKYGELGYLSKSDFYRDAVMHRIMYILKREKDLQGPLYERTKEAMHLAEQAQIRARIAGRRVYLEESWETLVELIAAGEIDEAENHVDSVFDVVTEWDGNMRAEGKRQQRDMRMYLENPEKRQTIRRSGLRAAS